MPSLAGTYGYEKKKKKKKKKSPALTRTKPKAKPKVKLKPKARSKSIVRGPTSKRSVAEMAEKVLALKEAHPEPKKLSAQLRDVPTGKAYKRTKSLNKSLSSKPVVKKNELQTTLNTLLKDSPGIASVRKTGLASAEAAAKEKVKADAPRYGTPSKHRSPLEARHGVDLKEQREAERAAAPRYKAQKEKGDPIVGGLKDWYDLPHNKFIRKSTTGSEYPDSKQLAEVASILVGTGRVTVPLKAARKVFEAGKKIIGGTQAAKVASKPIKAATTKAAAAAKRPVTKYKEAFPANPVRARAKTAREASRAHGKANRQVKREAKYEARAKAKVAKSDAPRVVPVLTKKRQQANLNKADKLRARRTDQTRAGAWARGKKPTKAGVARYASTAGKTVGPAALVGGGQEYAKATVDDPLAVLGTTGKAALGIPMGAIGIGADAVKSATGGWTEDGFGNPTLGPLEGQLNDQLDYLKKLASISNIHDLVGVDKAADPQKLIQEELGLIPLGGAALGVQAVTRAVSPKGGNYTHQQANPEVDEVGKGNTPGTRDTPEQARDRELLEEGAAARERGEEPTHAQKQAQTRALSDEVFQDNINTAQGRRAGWDPRRRESEGAAITNDKLMQLAANNLAGRTKPTRSLRHPFKGGRRSAATSAGKLGAGNTLLFPTKDANVLGIDPGTGGKVTIQDALQAIGEFGFRTNKDGTVSLLPTKELQAKARRETEQREGKMGHYRDNVDSPEVITDKLDPAVVKLLAKPENARKLEQARPEMQKYFDQIKYHDTQVKKLREKQGVSAILDRAASAMRDMIAYRVALPHQRAKQPEYAVKDLDGVTRNMDGFEHAEILRAQAKDNDDPKMKQAVEVEAKARDFAETRAMQSLDELALRRGADDLGVPERIREGGKLVDNPEALAAGRAIDYIYRPHKSGVVDPDAPLDVPAGIRRKQVSEQHRRGELLIQGKLDPTNPVEAQYSRIGSTLAHPYQGGVVARATQWARASGYHGPLTMTAREWRAALGDGKLPANAVFVPTKEFTGTLSRDKNPSQGEVITLGRERAATEVDGASYTMMNKYARDEMLKQAEPLSGGWKYMKVVNRAQSALLLALSPAWFVYQLMASPFALGTRHNVGAIYKAMRRGRKEYKDLDPVDRILFESNFGGVSGQAFDMNAAITPLQKGGVRDMARAYQIASNTPLGRGWNNIKKGGPLIALNRRYEAYVRRIDAIIEMDGVKKGVSSSKLRDMVHRSVDINRLTGSDLQEMKGKSFKDQTEYYAKNPAKAERLAMRVNDALGNWNALSAVERKSASALVFYPFIRFSSKWLLKTLPAKYPGRLAILSNLAQANVVALQEAGLASDFRDYGKILTHGQDAQPDDVLDLARAAPGAGPPMEILGQLASGERGLFQQLLGMTGPILSGAVNVATQQDPYTGEDVSEKWTQPQQILRALQATNPVTRHRNRSQSPGGRAFRKTDPGLLESLGLTTPETGWPSALRDLLPDLVDQPKDLKTKKELSDLYDIVSENRSFTNPQPYNEAKKEMEKWDLEHKRGNITDEEWWEHLKDFNRVKRLRKKADKQADKAQKRINEIIRKYSIPNIDHTKYEEQTGGGGGAGGDWGGGGWGSGKSWGGGGWD